MSILSLFPILPPIKTQRSTLFRAASWSSPHHSHISPQHSNSTINRNMPLTVRTRILIISDTHGKDFAVDGLPPCDVAIHCGDLTDGSKLEEFRTAVHNLTFIEAPLKLVIAGNHDFTMDIPAFDRKIKDAAQPLESELVAREYGVPGQVRKLFEDSKEHGIVFLDEGMHQFTLANGAKLSVYASPYTSSMGQWGFQYHPQKGHNFTISKGVDIAITHGPPKGIMDYTYGKERAGCPDLFTAIANARPRIHCFGHIHEGWGARLVTWKEGIEYPKYFSTIDNDRSHVIENLAGLRNGRFDSPEDIARKEKKREQLDENQCVGTSHCGGDVHAIEHGRQTLFVNAAIESGEDFEQRPWIVDIELPIANGTECALKEDQELIMGLRTENTLRKVEGSSHRVKKSNFKSNEVGRARKRAESKRDLKLSIDSTMTNQ